MAAVAAAVVKPRKIPTRGEIRKTVQAFIARLVVVGVLSAIQVLVLGIVLCPLAVLYVLGLYLSAGISLWRLIQHDYGNPDGGANLKPALNVLYSLAVAQGVVYGYRAIYDSAGRTGLVKNMAGVYSLETDLVSEYLDETVAGCMKDPSFARGRNLVTYALDLLMEPKSRYGYISGVLILGGTLRDSKMRPRRSMQSLTKQLLAGSASFSDVVQRLAQTFGPRSPYSTEIRVRAARIVAIVAESICLDQFPAQGRMIECISSLLDTFEEYSWRPEGYKRDKRLPKEFERDWLLDEEDPWYTFDDAIPTVTATVSYRVLVVQGLRILRKLAANEENCRVIANTQGLLSKTMATLGGTETSDQLHGDDHDKWAIIAEESLEFMNRLMATIGGGTETTTMMTTSEISSSNSQATIFRTLGCHKCDMVLKRKAAQLLLHLSLVDQPSIVPGGSGSIIFVWILLDIFLLPDYHFVGRICGATHLLKKSSYTKRLACEMMQAMISSKTEPNMRPSVVGDVIASLARTVAGAENNTYRIHAAMILKHLCEQYTKKDENLKELKKAMANVMPEVLKEIVHWLTTEEVQVVTEANNGGKFFRAEEDLEQGRLPHDNDNGQESSSTFHQPKGEQHQGIQLQKALIELCWEIYRRWINNEDHDLTCQFNEIAFKIGSGQGMPEKSYKKLMGEARDKLQREEEKRASRLEAVRTS